MTGFSNVKSNSAVGEMTFGVSTNDSSDVTFIAVFLQIVVHPPVQPGYLGGRKRVGDDQKSALVKFERERAVIEYRVALAM